jgi:hypothetical protein
MGLAADDWRLEAYDRGGNLLWRRGGLFSPIEAVAIAREGRVSIAHDRRRVLLLGSDGVTRWRMPLPGITFGCAGADATRVLVRGRDGFLRLLRVRWEGT